MKEAAIAIRLPLLVQRLDSGCCHCPAKGLAVPVRLPANNDASG